MSEAATDTQAQAQAAEEQVTLGDKRVETSQFDRYKGTKGRTDRLGIIGATLLKGHRCYHPGKKRSFRAPTNPEILELVKKALGPPEQRFGLVLFHYTTDDKGNLLDETKCQGKVKVWAISESRYEELTQLHRQWPLLDGGFAAPQHDFLFACTEEQYQRGTFTPCPLAQWKKKESWYKALKAKEALALPKVRLALGKTMTDLEIMELLGTALPSQTGGTQKADDVDLSDVIGD